MSKFQIILLLLLLVMHGLSLGSACHASIKGDRPDLIFFVALTLLVSAGAWIGVISRTIN